MTIIRTRLKITSMRLILLALTFFLSPFCFAQSGGEPVAKPKYELGAYTGILLLAQIPEVIDNVPPVVLKVGMNSDMGILEASFLHARGNDMRWRSALIDYRFDLDDLEVPFHVLFGFHVDAYQIYDGEDEYYGGGWHYGGGAHVEIIPRFNLRADFVNRFGPGRSLLVLVGLSVGIGDAEENRQ